MPDLGPLLSAEELRESVSSAGYPLAAWTATERVEDRCSNPGCPRWR